MVKRLYNGTIYRLKQCMGVINKFFCKEPYILGTHESLDLILNCKKSLARFGDGEFNLMLGKSIGFQEANQTLSRRLSEVLSNQIENLEIGLPKTFGSLKAYKKEASKFWKAYMGINRFSIIKRINLSRIYCNTNMTRFWTGYKNESEVPEIVKKYKKIWQNRDLIFVEGNLTRMGVGNDLFSNAKSIRRILCPSKNAWDRYDEILDSITKIENKKNVLFILALGPTATVLAYDVCKLGVQVLDLGHIDVQYEYFLKKAKTKIN